MKPNVREHPARYAGCSRLQAKHGVAAISRLHPRRGYEVPTADARMRSMQRVLAEDWSPAIIRTDPAGQALLAEASSRRRAVAANVGTWAGPRILT